MARIKIIRGGNLSDTASKDDVHDLVNDAVANIYDIVNADVKSDAAIAQGKLATISTIGKVNLSALTLTNQTAGDILYLNSAGAFARLPIGTAGQKLKTYNTVLDYMEYASDATARTAYVSNVIATGGTITDVGNDKVHTFTSSGTFTPTQAGNVRVLVVGGGGGGGYDGGGGGGAGGLIYNASFAVTAQAYSVIVGAGGAGATANDGSDGGSSVFSTLTAAGGGGGGGITRGGRSGGSGGGSGKDTNDGSGGGGAASPSGQGYKGGGVIGSISAGAGGGGGASEAGETGIQTELGGDGGDGLAYDISGSSVTYAGGGGGSYDAGGSKGLGGAGGGGDSAAAGTSAVAGTANRGGGGGGGSRTAPTAINGAAGGSGIVIIRYTPSIIACSEGTIKTQGSYALKGVATITASLNKTLTRTVSPTIDLSGINTLKFSIRSSRTGSNIKIGIHDSGGTTTETIPNITAANTWQDVSWDISGVSNANKDVIDQIIITIVNADAANTFYLDHFHTNDGTTMIRWETP